MSETSARIRVRRPLFLPMLLAVLLVFLGVYMAVHTGIASTWFMPSLNDPGPGLSNVEPDIEPVIARPRLARRVAIVIIDGLRLDDAYGLSYLDSLRQRGVDTSATSHYPSFSRPNYVTIVTGVPPRASGVRTNEYDTEVALDSLMDRVHAAGMRSAYVADNTSALPRMFSRLAIPGTAQREPRRVIPRYVSPIDDANVASWPGGLVSTTQRLVADGYPLMIVLPGAVDVAGHAYGASSPAYRDARRRVDAMLEQALAHLDLERDALIITADHGHTDSGGHGGTEPDVMEVPLILAGAGIRPGAAVAGARLIDIAPTAAALLGVPAPGHGLGRALTEALVMDAGARQVLNQQDGERIARNKAVVAAWKSQGQDQVAQTRRWRVPLMLVLLLGFALLIHLARRTGALHIDWRVLVIGLPAFPLTYYALVAVFGQTFSPSLFPDRGSVVSQLFRFGLVSTASHIVISWFVFHGRLVLTERLATANGLFACGMLSSAIPVALAWALMPGPFVNVPGPRLMVLIPATYVACACYALAVAATLALELVVFFARAVDPRLATRGRPGPAGLPGSGTM